jgi:phosphoribosylaminoimidazolecarboxamide formyltransferase/IMP cyclohydrolase
MSKIQRALLSVSDKSGLVPFAQVLAQAGVQLISTGGTARALREAGLEVVELGTYTGFPEMLDGRVKTLHPKVHGGLLYLRGNPEHEAAVAHHAIPPIDLVVVNLYPFEATVARPGVSLHDAIENIDIGGPSMLRSAAKNHESVTVVTDPGDYAEVARQVTESGQTTLTLRRRLAAKVYARAAAYDTAIATHLQREFAEPDAPAYPPSLLLAAPLSRPLRYGENPHQAAALYGRFDEFFAQLHGKELSYNNILDLTAAAALIGEFATDAPTLAILKHTNPCGVGQGPSLRGAWDRAFATDPTGSLRRHHRRQPPPRPPLRRGHRRDLQRGHRRPRLRPRRPRPPPKKENLRLIRLRQDPLAGEVFDLRGVGAGSFLLQQRDRKSVDETEWKTVTRRAPSDPERHAMRFGWRIVKHVKSNAIVYVGADDLGHGRTLGIGAGQMSRVDSSRIAVWKAGEAGLSLTGSVVCSDAFFPFPDGLVAAAAAGATAAIQPGGSVRDPEVVQAADERGLAMVCTGVRHFRH